MNESSALFGKFGNTFSVSDQQLKEEAWFKAIRMFLKSKNSFTKYLKDIKAKWNESFVRTLETLTSTIKYSWHLT